MDVEISQITKDEIEEFYNFFKSNYSSFYPWYSKKTIDFWVNGDRGWPVKNIQRQHENGTTLLVARAKGQIVGFFIGMRHFGGVAFGSHLAVLKDFRRKGIGKKLILRWEEIAKKQGAHALVLQTIAKKTENVKFYESLGFRVIGLHEKFNFGNDYYILQKNIQEPKEENYLK